MNNEKTIGNGRVLEGGFKRFSPGADQVHVPTSSRRAALAGIAMYPACRPESARAQKMAWRATSLLGPRALPGRPAPWAPPMDDDAWRALSRAWRWEVGDFDSVAIASRGEHDPILRLLLIQDGEPGALAKLAPSQQAYGVEREETALRLLTGARPHVFKVPRVLASGEVAGWRYVLVEPLPPKIHRMAGSPPLSRIVGETHMGLASLPRPAAIPNHWHPMHGQLAPWTLRELPGGDLIVLDWEYADWAPPGSDEVFYRASVSALLDESPGPIHVREAVEFWRQRFRSERGLEYRGPDFTKRLLRALDRMASESRLTGGRY